MVEIIYVDHRWFGPAALINAAAEGRTNVLGPRTLDGIAYVAIRSASILALPLGLSITGPELSAAILGVWA